MDYLEQLNPEQRRAAAHVDGPMLVVAGAGTGKTRVITHRIAQLIGTGAARPGQILALTFTDKAAREMRDRLTELIGWDAATVEVHTYNAFGGQLLHRFGSHVGRATAGGLLSDSQKAMLLQQRFGSLKLKYYTPQSLNYAFAEGISDYISKLQNAGVSPDDYAAYCDGLEAGNELHPAEILEQRDLAAMYAAYDALKAETGTYDYADQVATTVSILKQRPNLAERLGRDYRYVLVDEYQDTSPVQDAMLRLIVPRGGNIFAVGDDDQAIYGFRGSDVSNILNFTDHFGVKETVVLTENYRSGQSILDAAYRLIRHNDPDRLEVKLSLDKRLISKAPESEILYQPFATAAAEQLALVESIEQAIAGGAQPSEIAVLARGKATLRSVAKMLRSRGVPYAISAEMSIFEQRELLNLWHLLTWIGGRASEEAMMHVAMGPFIGWSVAQWRGVKVRAARETIDAESAISALADDGDVAAAELMTALTSWREVATSETVTTLAYRLVEQPYNAESGSLIDRLKAEAAEKSEGRVIRVINDLKRLFEHMDDFASAMALSTGDTSLAAYLATFPQPPVIEVDEAVGSSEGVQLLTVHASKGLEFETVFVINATDRTWKEQPDRGLVVPEALDRRPAADPVAEQRRLMYVAVTRAKKRLQLSSGVATAGGQKQTVSAFVTEMLGATEVAPASGTAEDKLEKSLLQLQRFYPLQEEIPTIMPFEKADGWIQLSVSQLERFEKHPHEFYMETVLGLGQTTGPQMTFGTVIHSVIQLYNEARLDGRTATTDELSQRLDELWSDRGYDSRGAAEQAHERARATVAAFVERERASSAKVVSSEQPILFELPEFKLRLTGRIDATFETADGLEVRDYKTGVRRDADKVAEEAKKSLQLRTYALALAEQNGQPPARVTLDFVVTGVEGSAQLSALILKKHREKLGQLADKLRARDFDPGEASEFNTASVYRYFGTAGGDE